MSGIPIIPDLNDFRSLLKVNLPHDDAIHTKDKCHIWQTREVLYQLGIQVINSTQSLEMEGKR